MKLPIDELDSNTEVTSRAKIILIVLLIVPMYFVIYVTYQQDTYLVLQKFVKL